MKRQIVNLATARIQGLTKPPYYWEHKCYYVWSIMFTETSTLQFTNLPFIKVGNTKEEAQLFCNQFKENFKKANIYDGDKVAVIFQNNGHVRAIGCIGKDLWIDTSDKFVPKTFKELNVAIISLKVY